MLQKHEDRPNSAYPKLPGRELNQQGQRIADEILQDPYSAYMTRFTSRFGRVYNVRSSDGRHLFFDANGNFIGFREP